MYKLILIGGEYDAHDFVKAHETEIHTIEEWENILKAEGLWYNVRYFETLKEMRAYESAIGDAENYLSSDYYTFAFIESKKISDSN